VNASNIITLSRISFTPLLLACFYFNAYKSGIILFSILCFSDLIDGYLARINNTRSQIGAILDPLADKILSLSIIVMLIDFKQINRMEIWISYTILFRELIATAIRAFPNIKKEASHYNKAKTLLLNISLLLFLINLSLDKSNYMLHTAAMLFMIASAALGLIGLWQMLKQLKNEQ
jgi:CDP-diacylglycerol--glycerol-3-phosphate 3-phosphatidyltransferase